MHTMLYVMHLFLALSKEAEKSDLCLTSILSDSYKIGRNLWRPNLL